MKSSKIAITLTAAMLAASMALTAAAATTTTATTTTAKSAKQTKTLSTAEKNYQTAASTARKYEKAIDELLKKHTAAKTSGIAALQTEYDALKETYKDVAAKGKMGAPDGEKGAPPEKPDGAAMGNKPSGEKPAELTAEQKAEMDAEFAEMEANRGEKPEKGDRPEMKQLTDEQLTTLTATLKKYNAALKTLYTKLKAL